MPSPLLPLVFLLILTIPPASDAWSSLGEYYGSLVSKTIVVDKSGGGDFTTVQAAVDSVPENNADWIQISVRSGIYEEKVVIPVNKPYITMLGDSVADTVIQSYGTGAVYENTTFTVLAQNFNARYIQFKNTFRPGADGGLQVALAAYLAADKISFELCSFIGIQDTLGDLTGRHYFLSSYIEGIVDFIWGFGQSVYQDCTINATGDVLSPGLAGFITAQGRMSPQDESGYVFLGGKVVGTGKTYLGRAYRQYSRVVFKSTYFSGVVVPEGWNAWNYAGQEETITYAEIDCFGRGSDTSERVKWMKDPSAAELQPVLDINQFINQDGWLRQAVKLPDQI
ncbi:hypothetical protein MLD38_001526 [Melastoma candidum]|uniref:Uncharacterized protein n=1 Tax=Melastoma candidum TaxID=119954 RepID=A0ACB9SEI0_9MYRT|nr:hypothetical protein MLD38_001526 [Melastoma candidum]